MTSTLFEAEDQTDEEFFDKLVNDDEIDRIGSLPACIEGVDDDSVSDDAKAFSNLSISEAGPTGVVDLSSGGKDGQEDDPAFTKESQTLLVGSNVNECGEAGLHSAVDKSSVSLGSGKGVKVVEWSSFNSDLHSHSGSGFGSGSGFFSEFGDNSEDPFANVGNVDSSSGTESVSIMGGGGVDDLGSSCYGQNQDGQHYGEQNINTVGQDLSSGQNWENLYPGWRYDPITGQWHQLDAYDANSTPNVDANATGSFGVNAQSVSNVGVQHLQTSQSVVGNVADGCTTDGVSKWNQSSQGNVEYPSHMVFDPQYPGWYYDTIAQEWKLLESYNTAVNQSASVDYNQQYQNKNIENYGSQGVGSQGHLTNWGESLGNPDWQNRDVWQTQLAVKSEASVFTGSQKLENQLGSTGHVNISAGQQGFKSTGSVASSEMASQGFDGNNEVSMSQSFNSAEQFFQHRNQKMVEPSQQMNFSPAYFASQKSISFKQQPPESGYQFSHATRQGVSSFGRPPHALVTFGFGGKLIVVKNNTSFQTKSAYGSEVGGVVNVLNLIEVVMEKTEASSFGAHDYFHTLCQQSFPGPLVGGSIGTKELNKWIDDQIANCESPYANHRNGEVVRLLFSLLKIACQHYGKLRSPFGTDQGLKESDSPESAVAKLFASVKSNSAQPSGYGAFMHCLQNFPSEAQIQATALQVQMLLVSGRKKEALECAKEGQLWGPALVLASQLGDKFYGDTVKQMALKQLVAGSPLRTLCLLIAGNPSDVFSNADGSSILPGSLNTYQQPAQIGPNGMLDEWEENLAIIAANRTKGDELVMIHLGDCLWKERSEVTAAHICYLVAEANLEPYSDSARLCLVGADHWKFPRTYASPEAIQRTELHEYSMVLGNSQFLLLPFQPYKLIYAYMLAEVGKVADSLKYCQAILKSLKTGRAPEVETWRQLVLSLEERLRTNQQGGYGNNLAPTKLVGKLLTFFDSTAQRVVGELPPPVPSTSHGIVQHNEHIHQPGGPKTSGSQSTMAISSLMPSASMEPISEWAGETSQVTVPNRSISEPNFGRTPKKVDSSKEASASNSQEKAAVSGATRFGRFGSQLFQKTVGLVLRSRPDRQAKLGERNKFYYDEKLKRWVEEGAEAPAEEAALPPPPTTAAFQNRMPNHNIKDVPETETFDASSEPEYKSLISSERNSGIPPMPPISNQFSARGRMGVRARYVDTFNKGGGTPANLFQSPPVPAAKPGVGANPKFFIPTPVALGDEVAQKTGESTEEAVVANENPQTSTDELFPSPRTPTPTSTSMPSSSMVMQRFPSMDNIVQRRRVATGDGDNLLPPHSRRVASWSGSLSDSLSPSVRTAIKPLGEALGMSSPSYMPMPSERQPKLFSSNSHNLGYELHEVQL